MTIENHVRSVLKNEYDKLNPQPEMKERVLGSIELRNSKNKPRKRLAAGLLIAILLIPSVVLAGYNYLADQIYGSVDNIRPIGGTQETYDHFESKLQKAQSALGAKDFSKFMLLLKDMAYYNLKMSDIKGNLHPEKLSAEETEKYEQIKNKIQPYFDKLNKSLSSETKLISIGDSQKMLSFPIRFPGYVPEGYTLFAQNGVIPKEGLKPNIHIQYENNKDSLLIMQYEIDQPQENMPQKFDKVTDHLLNGYSVKYGESEGQNGLIVWIPKTNEHNAYHIYVAGRLNKQELEKIVLSMIK